MTNIRKVFNEGTVNEKTALDGVSLTVKDGDFVTIIGSNGAGKSTLFNCIGGSFYPDEGSIFLDNQNITYMPEHKRAVEIGRLFQDPMKGTAPHMTIEVNLALAYLRVSKKKPVFSIINSSGWSKRAIITTETYQYDIIFCGENITVNRQKYVMDESIDSELEQFYRFLNETEEKYN